MAEDREQEDKIHGSEQCGRLLPDPSCETERERSSEDDEDDDEDAKRLKQLPQQNDQVCINKQHPCLQPS